MAKPLDRSEALSAEPPTGSELVIRDLKIALGPELALGDWVSLLYRAALGQESFNAQEWLESTFDPDIAVQIEYSPAAMLEGVFRGMAGMRAGGSIRYIHVPSDLAYGARGFRQVPPNADLYLEVTVVSIMSRNT